MEHILPNLICVGAQKAATTTIYRMLRQHSQIFVPEKKELHFFDMDMYQKHGLDFYANFFVGGEQYPIRVEFTPAYLYYQEVAGRICKDVGRDTKILIMLRKPIDRAVSQYRMVHGKGFERLSLREAFEKEGERLLEGERAKRRFSYFDRGLYYKQVKRYMERFPATKVILFEDLVEQPDNTMRDLYQFMGVDYEKIGLVRSNVSHQPKWIFLNRMVNNTIKPLIKKLPSRIRPRLRKMNRQIEENNRSEKKLNIGIDDKFFRILYDYYIEDIEKLEKLIDRDLSAWKEYDNKYRG